MTARLKSRYASSVTRLAAWSVVLAWAPAKNTLMLVRPRPANPLLESTPSLPGGPAEPSRHSDEVLMKFAPATVAAGLVLCSLSSPALAAVQLSPVVSSGLSSPPFVTNAGDG